MEHKEPVAIGGGRQQKVYQKKPQALSILLVALISGIFGSYFVYKSFAASGGPQIFSASCLTSHVANDDPIVFPGQPGAAHAHEFSGAWSTDAFSTPESLVASGTSCDPKEDTAAYWQPVLYLRGQRIPVTHSTPYYAKGNSSSETIKAWPQGFRMIADLKDSTPEKSGYPHAGWLCSSGAVDRGYTASLEKVQWHCQSSMQARIIFPDCWDGKSLDTINKDGTPAKNPVTGDVYPNNHRAHVTYGKDGKCPSTHPVGTPRIDLKITFKTPGLVDSKSNRPSGVKDEPIEAPQDNEAKNSSEFTLAGGGLNGQPVNNNYPVSTFHADFYNTWQPGRLEYLIDYCIRQRKGQSNTRPCLNPNSDATQDVTPNPNFPYATQPGGSSTPKPPTPTPTPTPTPKQPPVGDPRSGQDDSERPTAPPKVETAATGPTSVKISWTAATDNVKVTIYEIYRGPNTLIATVPAEGLLSYIDTTIGAGSTNSYSVKAKDAVGNISPRSPSSNVTTPAQGGTTPTPPTVDTKSPTVAITAPGGGSTVSGTITSTATAVDSPATSNGTGVSKVVFYLDNKEKLTDTDSPYNFSIDTRTLSKGSHTIKAEASDQAGNKATSSVSFTVNNADNADTVDTTAPSVPGNLTAKAANSNTVNLTWAASSDTGPNASGVAKYNVLRDGAVIAQTSITSYTDNQLVAKTGYTYNVQAVDKAGNNSASSGARIVDTPTPEATPPTNSTNPSTPTNLSATAVSATQVNLSWGASTDAGGNGIRGYDIYRSDRGDARLNTSGPVTATSFGDATAKAGTDYTYQIKAINGLGNSSLKVAVKVKTPSTTTVKPSKQRPTVPTNLKAQAIDSNKVKVSWTASSDNVKVTKYALYRNGNRIKTLDADKDGTTYTDTKARAGRTYSYYVRAFDDDKNSSKSAKIKVTTPSR